MLRKLGIASIAAALATVFLVGVVLATVITVDGNGADWPGNASPRTPGVQPCNPTTSGCSWVVSDAQGDVSGPLGPDWDISDLWATNDATNLYLRMDTYSNTGTWRGSSPGGQPYVIICLDSDNDSTTGVTQTAGICNKDYQMLGVDHYMLFLGTGSLGTGLPFVGGFYDCNQGGASCVLSSTATSNLAVGYNGTGVTEFQVNIGDLNYGPSSPQPITMTLGLYFDNGNPPSEDSLPDAPPYVPIHIGCGTLGGTIPGQCSPTAITLSSMNASADTKNGAALPVALVGVSAIALIGVVFFIRRRKTA